MKLTEQFFKAINRLADIRKVDPNEIAESLGMTEDEYRLFQKIEDEIPEVYVNRLTEDYHVNPEFLFYPERDVPIISTVHSPSLRDLQKEAKRGLREQSLREI